MKVRVLASILVCGMFIPMDHSRHYLVDTKTDGPFPTLFGRYENSDSQSGYFLVAITVSILGAVAAVAVGLRVLVVVLLNGSDDDNDDNDYDMDR